MERNQVTFKGTNPISFKALGTKIISLASFWCKSNNDKFYFKLTLIIPCDVKKLPDQVEEEEREVEEASVVEVEDMLEDFMVLAMD